MRKPILFLVLSILTSSFVFSQKYITKNGHIKFFSETPVEAIEAINDQVNAALDLSNGNIVFKVLIKSFVFEKALMQEHFNENYMESTEFPVSTFKGQVEGFDGMDFSKEGIQDVNIKGTLMIHGVSKEVSQSGTIERKGENLIAKAVFMVKPSDYEIKIAKAVEENIAKEIEVTVDVNLAPLKK